MRRNNSKSSPKICCAGVQILEDPNSTPMSSICFQPEFFKKSPDSLWNLGLSDLHLLRSEQLCVLTLTDDKVI